MLTQQYEITNALIGEIDDHFIPCEGEHSTRAGLVIERAQRQHGLLTLSGVDQETGVPFTATIRVHVQVTSSSSDAEATDREAP